MWNIKSKVFSRGLLMLDVVVILANATVFAAAPATLDKKKITVDVGQTKKVKVRNASKKVSWKILSGKKNVSIKKGKYDVKIRGKKAGKAKLQAKTGKRKFIYRITVTEKKNKRAAENMKIAVKSDKYTVVYRLNESKAAKDLYNQLPLSINVENYSNNEKIFYPPTELKTTGTPKSKGEKGSLAYYAPWGMWLCSMKAEVREPDCMNWAALYPEVKIFLNCREK